MNQIYLTTVPLQTQKGLQQCAYRLPDGGETEPTCFPIVPVLKRTMLPGDTCRVIALRQRNADTENNFQMLAAELAEKGGAAMYEELRRADPEAAAAIHPNNQVRVLRALEHYRATGRRLSEQKADSLPQERPYRSLILGLDFPDRAALYRRIDLRVDKMLEAGLLAEAEYVWRSRERFRTAAQAIGYKEFFPYFEGTAPLEACTDKLKQASRNYAKRQLTWFRHMDGVVWLDAGAPDAVETAIHQVSEFLSKR